MIDNCEYKVVHITDIPLINFIKIYSKSVFTADGSVFTSHSVETGIPFWAPGASTDPEHYSRQRDGFPAAITIDV